MERSMKHYTAALCVLSYFSLVAHPIPDFDRYEAPDKSQEQPAKGFRCGCFYVEDDLKARRHTLPKSQNEGELTKQLAEQIAQQQDSKKE